MNWANLKWHPDVVVEPSLTSTDKGYLLLTNFHVSTIFFRNDRVLPRIYNRGFLSSDDSAHER